MLEAPRPRIEAPSLAGQKAVLWLACAIILAVSLLALFSIRQLVAASSRVEHSQTLLVEIDRYLSDLKDVETGGRGYVLSGGDTRHLRRHEQGIADTATTVRRLRTLASDDPPLQQALNRLLPLTTVRIQASRQLIAERDDRDATRRNLLTGLILMDRIRDQVSAILETQQQQYRAESRALGNRALVTSIALAAGVLLCLAAIAWLFAVRGREVERRRRLEEELRAFNLELEDRVQERTAEVNRAGDLLNAVVENMPDMILLKEPAEDGFRYLLINAAGERLLGRDRSEILGKTERDLFPPDEAATVVEANKAVAASGQPRTLTDRKLTAGSDVRTVETRMVPLAIGNGGPVMILAIIRDISERRSREEQLRQLQRLDAVGRLTGGVAHDFNNLLAIIQGNSELLRSQLEDGSAAAEMSDDVIGAAERGAELVRRLLAFARMQHLEPEPVDLNIRLPNILGLLERSLGENVTVQIKPAKRLWRAIVDPTQVDDALVNLAINARDAMPDGGTLTIETRNVSLDEDYSAHHVEVTAGDYVMLAVSDTGTGMPPDVIARAFEPFFTTKEEGKGTGLGLSQVFGWIKQSGGHIKIYSEVGYGTTVKLYLPRAKGRSTEKEAEAETTTPTGDETIFVVEDNPKVRITVIRQLAGLGYKTVEAESGDRALELVEEGLAFDLLLTDVVMPGGITGYQLADQLRARRPGLRVLFTSGYTELAASDGHSTRNDPLLSKPYRKQDLGRMVRAVLDGPPPNGA
jgi:PAS domain S-box-containing protein